MDLYRKKYFIFAVYIGLCIGMILCKTEGYCHKNVILEEASSEEDFYRKVTELVKAQNAPNRRIIEDRKYESARIIVKSKDRIDLRKLDNVRKCITNKNNEYVIQFDEASQAKKAIDILQKDRNTVYVETDYEIEIPEISVDKISEIKVSAANISSLWGSAYIGTDVYSEYVSSKTNHTIVVAVVDSGIDKENPLFQGHIVEGYDFVDEDKTPDDLYGHGTHITGIILENTKNVNVMILPVRVLDSNGNGYLSVIANGIRYAAKHKASIINLSLGGNHSRYLDEAIEYALEQNIVCVAASGNENIRINDSCCPGHNEKCITVGSIGKTGKRSKFSNYGKQLDFVAPGEEITSTFLNGNYTTEDGTSVAVPHITACAALIKLMHPTYSVKQIELLLKYISSRKNNYSIYYGYGSVDMRKLLDESSVGCVHNMTYLKEVEATLDSSGKRAYYSCKICKKKFKDENGFHSLSEGDIVIPAIKSIRLERKVMQYTGKTCKPKVIIKDIKGNILSASHYKLTYLHAVKRGKAFVRIQLKDSYKGTIVKEFKIVKANISEVKMKQDVFIYNRKQVKIVFKNAGKTLTLGRDYSVDQKRMPFGLGSYHITIKGKGNYTGKKRFTYRIVPKRINIEEIRVLTKSIIVYWKAKANRYDGYEIQYSYDKSFEKKVYRKMVEKKKTTKKIKNIKSDRTIYIRMRGYKIIKGKKIYALWSSVQIIE